ncbi:MAG: serine hydrolase [Paludibacteraceae bacterium]|nr:serine hydrolase [Paludibacteraceae bacterium]
MKTVFVSLIAILLFSNCSRSNTPSLSAATLSYDIKNIQHRIDSLVSSYTFHGRFSGTVLIAHKDSIWYEKSFGYADFDLKKKNSNNSVYGIGSVTKQFTATAILNLVQGGKINLTDKLSSLLPELGKTGDKITIHHLLNMTSGIYEDFSQSKSYNIDKVIFPDSVPISTHKLVNYFGELTSYFKPGKKFDYSNINYILLAAIIEKVSGKNYREYMKETFWQPLGMELTDYGNDQIDADLLSKPYIGLPTQYETPAYWHHSWMFGAGGVFSSARDLYRWMFNVNNSHVLDSIFTQKLFQKHIKDDGNEHYGYGWQIATRKGNKYHYHGGGTLGYVCEIGFFPDLDLYAVVLTNHSHNLLDMGKTVQINNEINREIQNILFNEPYKKLPTPHGINDFSLEGRFSIGGFEYSISKHKKQVEISAIDNSPSILDIGFLQDLTYNGKEFKNTKKIAEAFGNEDFRFVRKNAMFVLKVLLSTKKLAEIWTELTGKKGKFVGYNFYHVPNEYDKSSYKVRLVYQNKEVGLLLTFNKRGKMKGMHIDQSFSYGGPKTVQAIPISDNLLFIDGFRHGYPDAQIVKMNGQWVVKTLLGEYLIK